MTADARTRARLLKVGLQLFSEKGFRKVTVRELCRAANANVAAVNYYFGGKEGLYREVLQTAVDAVRATTAAARTAGEGQSPEEQLRRFIGVFLNRILSPAHNAVHELLMREMRDPTPALDMLVEQAVRPRMQFLAGLVAAIMKCDPKDPRVMRCVGSIQSQAIMYRPNPIAARLGRAFKPTPVEIAKAADHIATFSLGGIAAVANADAPPRAKGRARRKS